MAPTRSANPKPISEFVGRSGCLEASNLGGLDSLVEQPLSEAAEAATEATLGLGLADL